MTKETRTGFVTSSMLYTNYCALDLNQAYICLGGVSLMASFRLMFEIHQFLVDSNNVPDKNTLIAFTAYILQFSRKIF